MLTYAEWKLNEEKQKQVYEYGCSMAYFDSNEIPRLQKLIDNDDVYTEEGESSYGLESEHHVTLLYGLHHDKINEEKILKTSSDGLEVITLHNPSLFKSEKYEVLKFDTDSDKLYEINKKLSKMPHTSTFDYHPHSTIGYLKPGCGQKYVNKFKDATEQVTPNQIVYTRPDGTRATCAVKV